MVSTTRKFSFAVVFFALTTAACQSDSITGTDPAASSFAKNGGAGGGGNAHWQEAETGYDPATHTFYFKAVGLGKNQSFTVTIAADIVSTYDCVNPGANLHIPKAFQGVSETVSTSKSFLATKNGQVTGSLQLDLVGQGELRCPPPQNSPQPVVGGWQAANIEVESVGGVVISVTPGYLPKRYY